MKLFALLLAAVSFNLSSISFADNHEGKKNEKPAMGKKCDHCKDEKGDAHHGDHGHDEHPNDSHEKPKKK